MCNYFSSSVFISETLDFYSFIPRDSLSLGCRITGILTICFFYNGSDRYRPVVLFLKNNGRRQQSRPLLLHYSRVGHGQQSGRHYFGDISSFRTLCMNFSLFYALVKRRRLLRKVFCSKSVMSCRVLRSAHSLNLSEVTPDSERCVSK